MEAAEHSRVWSKVGDNLDAMAKSAVDERAGKAQHDLLCLAVFARAIALAYRDFALEQCRALEAARRLEQRQ